MSHYVGTTVFIAVIGWVTFYSSIQALAAICPYCVSLWDLQSITSGPIFEQLNQASGRNHTDLVLVTGDTSASHSLAQPIFVHNTLISAEGSSNPGLYLGNYPQRLVLGEDVILTLQGLLVYNVAAKFSSNNNGSSSTSNSSSSSSSNGDGTDVWSLSLDSFSLSPGSLLRFVHSRVVLQDCQVAQQLYDAASEQRQPQPPGFNITQGLPPDVYILHWSTPKLEMENVLLTCNAVCGSESGGVRTLRVTTAAALREALRVVSDHVDGCSAYELELAANLSLAEAWDSGGGAAAAGGGISGSLRRLLTASVSASAAVSRLHPSLGPTRSAGDANDWGNTLPRRGRKLATADAGMGSAVRVTVNLTLRGVAPGSSSSPSPSPSLSSSSPSPPEAVVLDAALLRSVFLVQPPARISLERITLINLASPQTGVLALPMYFVASANISTATGTGTAPLRFEDNINSTGVARVALRNVTLVLAQDELLYESTWLQSYAEGLTSSTGLSRDQAAWLRNVILEAELQFLSLDSISVSRFRFMDIDAADLQITSKVPTGFTLSQPTIGISHFAPTPLDSYPQILAVNSTAALVSALNASAGNLNSQPGLFEAYPGVPSMAAVSLDDYNRTAASVYAPVSYGRVVLQRSYVVGPYMNVISSAAAAGGVLPPPVLDFGHTRSTWAAWGGSGFSLTLRNLTLVGLSSPARWPSDRLVRCLDFPVWALEGSRLPSLSGDPPALILVGATVSVSPQELDVWTACYQILTGSSQVQQQQDATVLLEACRSLGLVVFKARRIVDSRALQIELLQVGGEGEGETVVLVTGTSDLGAQYLAKLQSRSRIPGKQLCRVKTNLVRGTSKAAAGLAGLLGSNLRTQG
ncbi:hypothetical protein Vretimale_13723 [Volvox reticuliferus]|uniref:Uncharacterized protein n=1 Tax=Volvox reticuliferus TaxID=1737510 RepID=A0A8J4FTH5_9CHLO|nr:hypothetical protein Vretifemale_14683 [Volvox reticuliferus]GIM09940.1 hypothetical protein Vretimale_13723 [Volvox reticuliferus]